MEHLGDFDFSLVCALQMDLSVHFSNFPLFLSNKGGNKWIIDKTSAFMEYSRYFQRIYPSQANSLTQRLNFSPQAKLEQQV